ncbi:calcium/manganese antiporter SLC30A10 isoform X1 [Tribolium castaneum]|nr:PREDICTED: zinc transporter 10 isoform X1 [Tribolium castaneum]|eukprot:XP_973626.3 PREDICTED: zinc transporter 10 isoform X1 [Tribolium castaneum]
MKGKDYKAKMPVKEWFRSLQPIQLYVILILTVMFFITELIFSHITHALTLLMDSYHMLCNILALTGCIITIKNSNRKECSTQDLSSSVSTISETVLNPSGCSDKRPNQTKKSPTRANQESKLKNTFGWARIDVISLLICCIFMASLSFSVFVEALQTLVHIDHLDEMHHPLSVLFIGAAGLLLNGVCYLLIGGYTFHQGSFLYVTESGDVVLDRVVVPDLVKQGGRRLSRTRPTPPLPKRQRQGFLEMCRDVIGCVFVIICALIVYFTDKHIAKYVDPILSLVSAGSLLFLSYPHMKESCLILLQTIPDSINIDVLKKDLISHFPDIVNVHDFHVWQLTATKIISTVHIIFENQKSYNTIMDDIKEFLIDNGITQVTIQPEFYTKAESAQNLTSLCLMQCQGEGCKLSHCCPNYESTNIKLRKGSKSDVKEALMLRNSLPDLRSIKIINNEFSKTTDCLTRTATTQSSDKIPS